MKITKQMPDVLLRAAKSVAAIPEQTLKQLVPTAIERELAANRTMVLRSYPPKIICAGSESAPPECDPCNLDGLLTIHNHDFMVPPTFKAAYQRGVTAAGTDYNIVDPLAISCRYL